MKLKPIARVTRHTKIFKLGGQLFEVKQVPLEQRTVWTLHKRFRGQVNYRVLSDTVEKVPVAILRLAA